MFAVAVTNVPVRFPKESPKNVDAYAFPEVLMFPLTCMEFPTTLPSRSATIVGVVILVVATMLAPVMFPRTSTASVGGNTMFATAVMPVRPDPFPTKNAASMLLATRI